jgi:hypothetical protein
MMSRPPLSRRTMIHPGRAVITCPVHPSGPLVLTQTRRPRAIPVLAALNGAILDAFIVVLLVAVSGGCRSGDRCDLLELTIAGRCADFFGQTVHGCDEFPFHRSGHSASRNFANRCILIA